MGDETVLQPREETGSQPRAGLVAGLDFDDLARRTEPPVHVSEQFDHRQARTVPTVSERKQGFARRAAIARERLGPRGRQLQRNLGGQVDAGVLLPQKREAWGDADIAQSRGSTGRSSLRRGQVGEIAALVQRRWELDGERKPAPHVTLCDEPPADPIAQDRLLTARARKVHERLRGAVQPEADLEAFARSERPRTLHAGIAVASGGWSKKAQVHLGRGGIHASRSQDRRSDDERYRWKPAPAPGAEPKKQTQACRSGTRAGGATPASSSAHYVLEVRVGRRADVAGVVRGGHLERMLARDHRERDGKREGAVRRRGHLGNERAVDR